MSWILLAIIATSFSILVFLFNEYFQQCGLKLLFWRGLFPVLLLSPLIFLMQWPTHPVFYMATFAAASLAAIFDIIVQNAIARFGGGVISRLLPFSLLGTFIAWFFFVPDLFFAYLAQPFRFAAVGVCFLGAAYFLSTLRHCHITRQAFWILLPALFCGAFVTIFSKTALRVSPNQEGVFGYIILQGAVMTFLSTVLLISKRRGQIKILIKELSQKRLLLAGFCFAFGVIFNLIPKNNAFILTSHPAYVNAIIMTTPVWIVCIYRLIGRKEDVNIKSGLLAVFCVIVLSILAL